MKGLVYNFQGIWSGKADNGNGARSLGGCQSNDGIGNKVVVQVSGLYFGWYLRFSSGRRNFEVKFLNKVYFIISGKFISKIIVF